MKKEKLLSLLYVILFLVLLTGCGSQGQKLIDEKSVFSYLKQHYPEEEFEIVSKQEVENIADDGCTEIKKGNKWIIKSKTTSIEFTIMDEYHFNSFVCNYGVNDNYLRTASSTFYSKINDNRITTYYSGYYTSGFAFKREDFNTSEEMIDFVSNIMNELQKTYPFKYDTDLVKLSFNSKKGINNIYSLSEISNDEVLSKIIDDL